MNVKQFLSVLGNPSEFLFRVTYYNENGTEIDVDSEYVEAAIKLFGGYMLEGEGSIFFETIATGKPIIHIYIGTLEQDGGAE